MKKHDVVFTLLAVSLIFACAPAPTTVSQPAAQIQPADLSVSLDHYLNTQATQKWNGIAPTALRDALAFAKPFVLDVREPKELADNGFIEGAVNIPLRELPKNLDKLPAKDHPIVTLCAVGHRGAMAMMTLHLLGYANVKNLSGGFAGWRTAQLPVAKGAPVAPAAGKPPEVDRQTLAMLDKYLNGQAQQKWNGIAPASLKDGIAAVNPFLVDVREPSELAGTGIIEGSVNIPLRTLIKNLDKLPNDKSAPTVVYCAIGHRGAMAMMTLHLLGRTNVKSLSGGLTAWKAANLPTVKAS